ncbi:hypothetical protein EII34_10265 [Arachnia propionica]|uniref:DUF8175 domain-containing protein n=1 Tax=Arachnia propionica TaxID=1750 RepID=A0A3P1T6I4_9ACTN|nr:hypothetical protein [Arachnia propionica]RRD04436.1 hypothetical protein EII34_10265 [Arachnia propionica]
MSEQMSKPSKWMIPSMVVVAAIVVLAIFVIVSNLGARTEPAASTPAASTPATDAAPTSEAATPAASESAADSGASWCGLTAVEMTGTLTEAPNSTWTRFGTTWVPAVDGHGPAVIDDDGYRHCYARTPTGAVLALANYRAIPQQLSDALDEKFVRTGVAPGPGRDAGLEKLKQPSTETPREPESFQTVAFRILTYDGSSALVETVSQSSKGYKLAWAVHLVWVEGDWKILPSDDGNDLTEPTLVRSLDGYIPWGP